jgi:glutamyl-Q tRNA(Asp) synthetase
MYRGRFAPSPTGPLHFGSLVTAVGSYLQAKSQNGKWLVRIEDLDPPRTVKGAAKQILLTLEKYGLYWDGPIWHQSSRSASYAEALRILKGMNLAYACGCSRKEIMELAQARVGYPVYPGTCRNGLPKGREARALRLRTDDQLIEFEDVFQGRFSQALEQEVGDFVIHRADGVYAYQLAVVLDDADQDITQVVRGCDLLDSTPRQIFLQKLLELPTPGYAHLPVVVNEQGQKLSKQTGAAPVDLDTPLTLLVDTLRLLGQNPPPELLEGELDSFWRWAIANWCPENVPAVPEIPISTPA